VDAIPGDVKMENEAGNDVPALAAVVKCIKNR
jgi:hypothetical protein